MNFEHNPVWALVVTFGMMSLFAVGGANAAVPEIHRIAVDVRHWLTDKQFADVFAFGDASGTMDAIQGPLLLDGQAGANFVIFYDWASAVGHTYTFTADTMTRDGMAPVRFSGMNQVIQYTGRGDDRVNWRAVGAPFFLVVLLRQRATIGL